MTAAIAPSILSGAAAPVTAPTLLNLLIVDDERSVRDACRDVALTLGYRASTCESPEQAIRLTESQNVDVLFLDMDSRKGLDVVRHFKTRRPDMELVIMTANGSVESAVDSMKAGAYDYMTKPFTMEQLKVLLDRVSSHLRLKTENRMLREKMKSRQGFGDIIGCSAEMDKLYRMITKAAHSIHPVLILGESGTGKEMVARAIHRSGPLRDKPFIPVDCGSLVPTLIESELFGYTKGAFTGAMQSKDGLLAIAEGGTVFLDEVGELPVDLQSKLLRALQEKEIRPVGSTKRVPINVRILAATNRDLDTVDTSFSFRRDLYFRLNVLSLRIPPLRERRQDIPLLTSAFLERTSRNAHRRFEITDEAMKTLLAYDWPGNVRELENCLDRCCALNSGLPIQKVDLPSSMTGAPGRLTTATPQDRIVPLYDLEKQAILNALTGLNGDKLLAAKLLGIGKTTLYRKLKEYGAEF